MNKDEIDAVAEVTKEVIKPVYEDGLKPATVEVGKSLQTVAGVVNVALMPISVMVHGFKEIEDKLKEGLSRKLNGLDKSQIVEPPLNVVGPLLEKYKYNHDTGVLSDMFISLLANSMDSERSAESHPAFVDIISQLSPDEAKLFKAISVSDVCPKIDLALKNVEKGSYNLVRKNLLNNSITIDLQFKNFIPAYIDNLQRLNLISVTSGSMQHHYSDEKHYEELLQSPIVKSLEKLIDVEKQTVVPYKGFISVTDFGKSFYRAVTRDVVISEESQNQN
jgi:hypothetical protein